jgi:hypothetical protein
VFVLFQSFSFLSFLLLLFVCFYCFSTIDCHLERTKQGLSFKKQGLILKWESQNLSGYIAQSVEVRLMTE